MQVPQLHLGVGTALGPLSIFPVWTSGHGDLAISTGAHANVAVNELPDGAQVGKLMASNNGPRPALLLEGELLEGGKQHRTCAHDVILGAGETRTIGTYCVEEGRWEAGMSSHRRQSRRAPLTVRAELASRVGASDSSNRQGRIWERVRRLDAARGASATNSLVDHLDRQALAPSFDPNDALPPIDGQRGVLFGIGTQPLVLEIFGTHTMFRRHYHQLIRAALLDLELLPAKVMASNRMSGQQARDFAAVVQGLDFGAFDGGPLAGVRSHGPLRSRPVSSLRAGLEGAGIAVELPHRGPELAHLTVWNTKHPLMEMV
ncbi:hypothetical protein HAV21_09510 [Paenarthrobacter sp. MSM-2-10-13]|uniref:ARPP-1 family domain-containing protein n=1 Tax=Paenarthrobacter sp. MSM-2-10-13 TaxID=2717318 RepID=UPI001422B0BB|nr:DUF6569 family protein [Paenarthrobacter sp. MSM-2-10-13]NHW47127.1 hypothetical protein [Paenarthrobacter sp. MSM-2-10-13]